MSARHFHWPTPMDVLFAGFSKTPPRRWPWRWRQVDAVEAHYMTLEEKIMRARFLEPLFITDRRVHEGKTIKITRVSISVVLFARDRRRGSPLRAIESYEIYPEFSTLRILFCVWYMRQFAFCTCSIFQNKNNHSIFLGSTYRKHIKKKSIQRHYHPGPFEMCDRSLRRRLKSLKYLSLLDTWKIHTNYLTESI